ncbi:MAG: DUF3617 family protein [Bacteroidia bacterium]
MSWAKLTGFLGILLLAGACSSSEKANEYKRDESSSLAEINTSKGASMFFKTGLWRVRTRIESFEKMRLKVMLPEMQTEFCMDEMMAQAKRAPFGGVPSDGQSPIPDCKFENLRIQDGRMRYDLVCPNMRGEIDITFSETKFEGEYKLWRGEAEVMSYRMIGEYVGECGSSGKNLK